MCKKAIEKGECASLFSIVNRNFPGGAPECLKELTSVELALITPVRAHGFVFSHAGGKQINLKGSCVFLHVKERERISRGIMELEAMGLNKHVIIVANGMMTKEQIYKVRCKSEVRTDKLIAAVEWLC